MFCPQTAGMLIIGPSLIIMDQGEKLFTIHSLLLVSHPKSICNMWQTALTVPIDLVGLRQLGTASSPSHLCQITAKLPQDFTRPTHRKDNLPLEGEPDRQASKWAGRVQSGLRPVHSIFTHPVAAATMLSSGCSEFDPFSNGDGLQAVWQCAGWAAAGHVLFPPTPPPQTPGPAAATAGDMKMGCPPPSLPIASPSHCCRCSRPLQPGAWWQQCRQQRGVWKWDAPGHCCHSAHLLTRPATQLSLQPPAENCPRGKLAVWRCPTVTCWQRRLGSGEPATLNWS